MKKFQILAATLALLAVAQSVVISGVESQFWTKSARVGGEELHSVIIAVKQLSNALDSCDSWLMKVSSPDSPFYGQYLSLDEIRQISVDENAVSAIKQWLEANQISYQTNINEDFITAYATIQKWEDLLDATYHQYVSFDGSRVVRRTESYTIPQEIESAVDFISNTVNFPPVNTRFLQYAAPTQTNQVSLSLLNKLYSIDNNEVSTSSLSCFEALGQNFSPADLQQFQTQNNIPADAPTVTGANDPTQCTADMNNCAEANLDIQWILGVAQKAPANMWMMDPNSLDPFFDWINALSNTTNPPMVNSMSYGSLALEDPRVNMERFNTEACKLGLRGVTILISSGDDGVANFIARNNATACGFMPSFPATCPYITAVGATQGPESGNPEIACSSSTGGIVTTGGGFSFVFPRPSYQESAVSQYLRNTPLPPTNLFNNLGRGYPDVAALGFNYPVVIAGSTYMLSGTSASSPVVAGMITLINDARIKAGKPHLGFLNPALYQFKAENPAVFNDITVGENNCCAGDPTQGIVCCQYGFNATVGWDPLTGLGSFQFSQLKAAFLNV